MHTHTYNVGLLGLFMSFALVGCGETGSSSGLRAAGYVSTSQASSEDRPRSNPPWAANAMRAGAGAEEAPMEDPESDIDAASDESNDQAMEGSTDEATEELPGEPGPFADDSVRCGNGVLDHGELCDISIAPDEPGACPSECEQLDACRETVMEVRACWTQCVPGPELPCD